MSDTLLDRHDAVLLDLDGTVYQGNVALPGAYEAIRRIHERDVPVRYVTNNASRSGCAVAEQLVGLGLPAEAAEVNTSAEAGASLLAARLPRGARVLVVGTEALAAEVEKAGLTPVRDSATDPAGVIQGHSPQTNWKDLAEAFVAIRRDALWVACNDDVTLPTERGPLPGNGAMVAALRAASARSPQVAGKPQRPLFDSASASAGATHPLVVGDRLETDIAGAVNSGLRALFVLSGVSTPADLLFAEPGQRPDWVARDLGAVHRPAAESAIDVQESWKVRGDDAGIELVSSGAVDGQDPLPALRALCAFRWSCGSGPVPVRPGDERAATALRELDLV